MTAKDPMTVYCLADTRKGTPCEQVAGKGTSHVGVGRCNLHGGKSPQAEVSGCVTLARREALTMGRPLDIEPHEAILQCIKIVAGEVHFASEEIAKLDTGEVIGPLTTRHTRPMKEEKGGEDPSHEVTEVEHGPPMLHIWIQARHQAMDRLVNYSAVALKAGIEDRQVKLAEQQGQILVAVIRGILTELGVLDRPETPGIIRKHLTLVAGQ